MDRKNQSKLVDKLDMMPHAYNSATAWAVRKLQVQGHAWATDWDSDFNFKMSKKKTSDTPQEWDVSLPSYFQDLHIFLVSSSSPFIFKPASLTLILTQSSFWLCHSHYQHCNDDIDSFELYLKVNRLATSLCLNFRFQSLNCPWLCNITYPQIIYTKTWATLRSQGFTNQSY